MQRRIIFKAPLKVASNRKESSQNFSIFPSGGGGGLQRLLRERCGQIAAGAEKTQTGQFSPSILLPPLFFAEKLDFFLFSRGQGRQRQREPEKILSMTFIFATKNLF